MAFTILRKSKAPKTLIITGSVDPNAGLKHMKFKGQVEDRPYALWEDPSMLQSQMKAAGIYLPKADARALWIALSVDHYPFGDRPEEAWLEQGRIRRLATAYALDYLEPAV